MEKAYKFRIYPNKKQKEILAKTFGCCRFVYNHYKNRRNYGDSLVNIFPLGESSQEPCDFSRGRFR